MEDEMESTRIEAAFHRTHPNRSSLSGSKVVEKIRNLVKLFGNGQRCVSYFLYGKKER